MSTGEDEVVEVRLLGPSFGWACTACDQAQMGFDDRDRAKSDAELHAMVKHAPPLGAAGSGRTSMKLYVVWNDEVTA